MVPVVVSMISLCVSVLSFFFFRRYIRRQTAATRLLADYRDEVGRLIAEIDAATDRDSLLVEERIKILRKLLEDTDRRIATYVRELQRSRKGEAMYASLGRGIRAALDTRPVAQEQPPVLLAEPVPSQDGASDAAPVPMEETNPAGETSESVAAGDSAASGEAGETVAQENLPPPMALPTALPKALPSTKSKLKAQIAEMSARDIPPQEIASKLDISLAEVDFALNLLNRPAS